MAIKRFDKKFGADFLKELPTTPAVYLFKDKRGEVLYAGKARNIRRRLKSYRNASRRKVDKKMRTLVREASEIEVRLQESERAALLLENELIRTLRPRHNIDGAYPFLYPALGTAVRGHQSLFVLTTETEPWAELGLRWHGSFRSRLRALEAFEALLALLEWAGHREPRARYPDFPRIRGSRVAAFRRVAPLVAGLDRLLAGQDPRVLQELSELLLANPDARLDAHQIGEDLRRLDAFFREDARPLHDALKASGRRSGFVAQQERDALFIAARP
jgi:predicted GIY-YIG superfamily endonuclease